MRVWEDCPKKWDFAYVQDLYKPQIKKKHFDFGNYAHELMHVYYQTLRMGGHKPGSEFLIEMMKRRVMQDLTGDNILLIADVWPRILSYLTHQSRKIDAGTKVLQVEYEFNVPMQTPNGNNIALHGFVDEIYQDLQGVVRIRDHKTGATNNPMFGHSEDSVKLDDQLLFYAVAISELTPINPVLDVEINFVNSYIWKKKQPPIDSIFKLYRYRHTPIGLSVAKQNILEKIDIMLDTPSWKNYSSQCKNCAFFSICHLESRGVNTTNLINTEYERGRNARGNKNRLSEEASIKEHSNRDTAITVSFTDL